MHSNYNEAVIRLKESEAENATLTATVAALKRDMRWMLNTDITLQMVRAKIRAALDSTTLGDDLLAHHSQLREGIGWCYQLAGAIGQPVEVLDNLSALAHGVKPRHEWKAASCDLEAQLRAATKALEPFAKFGEYIRAHPPRRGLNNRLYGWDDSTETQILQTDLVAAAAALAEKPTGADGERKEK